MNHIFIEENKKWYEQTIFLCLCFASWFFIIPLFVGVISLILFFVNNYNRNKISSERETNKDNEIVVHNDDDNDNAINQIPTISDEDKNIILEELEKSISTSFNIQSHSTESISLYKKTKVKKYLDNYVVLDLETTGFDPNSNEIIEIGAIKYKDNIEVAKFNCLINPKIDIPQKVTKLTGITNEDVSNCDTIDIVFPKFMDFIGNDLLVVHNGSFDFSFIEKTLNTLKINNFTNNNVDTLYLARENIKDCKNHKLETLKEYFNLEFDSHRALADCKTTNYIYQYCKNKK